MATSRGITETKIYDRQAVIDRYGIPPELIPDFYGLKGDTSDNIPGVPGIGDKTASELIQTFGALEDVLAHVDEITGAKRKQNLLEHADDARVSKRLATVQRDVDRRLRRRRGGRARARSLARARGVPRVRAARSVAPPGGGAGRCRGRRARARPPKSMLGGRVRAGTPADIARLGRRTPRSRSSSRAAETPEGALFADGAPWRFAVAAGEEVLVGDCEGPEQVVGACAQRPVVAHDAKSLGLVPPGLAHDTLLGAYLLEPARRGYPFAELCESAAWPATSRKPLPPTRCCSARSPTGSARRSSSVACRA